MSVIQLFAVVVMRCVMLMVLVAVIVLTFVTACTSAWFAASLTDGFGVSLLVGIAVLAGEVIKSSLPAMIYHQRIDSPRMAEWAFGAFLICAVLSFASTTGWALSGEPSKPMAVVLVFAQFVSMAGPLGFMTTGKWVTEKPADGTPRQIAQPDQRQALPPPQGGEEDIRNAFGDWLKQRLSLIPTAQVALQAAHANYSTWAMTGGQLQIHPRDFEFLMNEAAAVAGASVENGVYTGIWFADRDQQPVMVS